MFRSAFAILLYSTLTLSVPLWKSIGALYTMTNDPSGNNVIINAIGVDGSISYSGAVSTGGKGLHTVTPGKPPAPDSLFSQGSMQVAGNHLFLVNPGSNTVSMFGINPVNPRKISIVGKPVNSGGEFPVSLTVSPSTGDVCVLNGGKVNGVQCFSVDAKVGLNPRGKFSSFGLNLTTPPTGLPNTVSSVLFSEDGSTLRASVKGDLSTTTGFIASWEVSSDGTLSSSFKKSVPPTGDGAAPFGMSNIPGSPDSILASDPGLGATVYDFSGDGPLFSPLTIKGQSATCWTVYAKTTESYFLTDLAVNKIYEVEVNSANEPALVNTYNLANNTSPTDLAVATGVSENQYLYMLSPYFASFNVYELKRGKSELRQTYVFGSEVKGVPLNPVNLAGAAVYTVL